MNKITFLTGLLALSLATSAATAADDTSSGESSRRGDSSSGRRFRPDRGNMGMERRDPRAEAEAQLKQKYPAEYAEIEKLRAEVDAKLTALAQKAGIELPKTYAEQLAELKQKYPKEMAEIEELRKTDRMAAFRKMRELAEKAGITLRMGGPGMGGPGMGDGPGMGGPGMGDGPGMGRRGENGEEPSPRQNPGQQLRELRQKFPKEMAEIEELRKTDPAAAREKIRELLEKLETSRTRNQ